MIKIVKGDLLKVEKGIIVHQVNCQKTMGSGIALSIRKKYPSHYIQYLQTEPQLGQIIITPINQKLFIIGYMVRIIMEDLGALRIILRLKVVANL